VWSQLLLSNRNRDFFRSWVIGTAIFFLSGLPVGMIFFCYDFNAFYEQRLNCVFSFHAICTAHDYFIIVTHTLHLSEKNTLSRALVITDCCHLPPLSQVRFSFTYELSDSGIVVLCIGQKFINISHEKKLTLKSRSRFFFQKSHRIDRNLKKRNRDDTTLL